MDHVEECPSYYVDCWGTICYCDYSHICMCRELRACEERVIAAAVQRVEAMDLHGCHPYRFPDCNCLGPQVIAAIDALREGDQP